MFGCKTKLVKQQLSIFIHGIYLLSILFVFFVGYHNVFPSLLSINRVGFQHAKEYMAIEVQVV